jgi:uncharacterized protein (TIGR02996 family)
MPTEAELLAAIDASPNDDAPRLALADFIEASNPKRARFIRLQVGLVRIPNPAAALVQDQAASCVRDSWASQP